MGRRLHSASLYNITHLSRLMNAVPDQNFSNLLYFILGDMWDGLCSPVTW